MSVPGNQVIPQGQTTGGALADAFSGVNRPALNNFIATSQARNGLVSAQTQDAMIKASQAQEEQAALGRLKNDFIAKGARESDAQLMTDAIVGAAGHSAINAEQIQKGLATATLGDPSQMGTPAQTAAQQAVQGKVAEPVTLPNNYTTLPGTAPVVPQQSPQGVAQTAATNASAGLHASQAAGHGQTLDPVLAAEVAEYIRQNPGAASNMRALVSNGGAAVIHAFLHPDPNAAPSTPANGITPAPGVSLQEQAAIRKDFAAGTAAKQTTALNTMVQHSQLFDAIADQLNNGEFTPSNYVSQLWQRTFGSPVPGNLQIAGDFLGREAVRATVNSGSGTGAERELQVNASSSPEALHGAGATLRSLAAGQLHSLDIRAQRGGVDIAQLLGPEAQAVFGRRPASVAAPNTPTQAAPTAAPLGERLPSASNAPAAPPSNVNLPAYASEQAALAAGHKAGDRVMIGGVVGTLQ